MISALLVTYNRRDHISRAVDSIFAQKYPVDEVVVVDDGSTDGTAEFLREKYSDRIRIVRQENQGVSAARRRAVLEAKGTWSAFLDSDDEWTLDRNEAFQKMIVGIPDDVAWVFGDTAIVRDEGIVGTIFQRYAAHMDLSSRVLGDSMSVQLPFQLGLIQSSLYRRSALLEVNCFSEGLTHSEDFLVGVQIAVRYRVAIIPNVVTRLFRTAELKGSSVDLNRRGGQDYNRARLIAAREAIQAGQRQPWTTLYAESARALCLLDGGKSKASIEWAREQLKYSSSLKSMAFYCAARGGWLGIAIWKLVAGGKRGLNSLFSENKESPENTPLL